MNSLLALVLLTGSPDYSEEITAAIADTQAVWPVPSSLVRAVIRQESAFNPKAVSAVGAIGLMQVMPFNASKLGVTEKDLVIPRLNILAGVRLLAALLNHYKGDVVAALVAYNSGPKAPGKVPSNGETPGYVLGVLRFWREYEGGKGLTFKSSKVVANQLGDEGARQ